MQYLNEDEMSALADVPALVPLLAPALAGAFDAPQRAHIDIPGPTPSTLLLMPAWHPGHSIGVKVITVDPARSARGQHAVNGVYVLLNASSGEVAALLGARTLTATRTAAVAALAASLLAPPAAATLLMAGTGHLAPYLICGHAAVRPIRNVLLWGRSCHKAEALAERLRSELPHLTFTVTGDLAAAARQADIVSCATASSEPLLHAEDIRPGTHVDLVGSFKPAMREADPSLIARARVFVDTLDALHETGDLIPALTAGLLSPAAVTDLRTLVRNPSLGLSDASTITLFKAVGMAVADLVTAEFFLARAAAAQETA